MNMNRRLLVCTAIAGLSGRGGFIVPDASRGKSAPLARCFR